MRTAIIFSGGVKQIVFTAETDEEKMALNLMSCDDDIEMLSVNGSFGDSGNKPFTATVSPCRAGYLRVFSDENSRILVFKPKKKHSDGKQ